MTDKNKERLNEYIRATEEALKKYNPETEKTALQQTVVRAMNYSLEAGGKRIRPVLALEFCRLCGGEPYKAIAPACAIEMVHTASLIHDDLPCMDNDDYRRGKLSCHKKFGEAMGVLAGDALFIMPFGVIAGAELDAETKVKIISELATLSNTEGMIGGQVIDIENEQRESVDEENLSMMYACKTGAIIRAACRMGCIAGGASEEQLRNADEYAKKLGLAFQIIDDILDVTSTVEKLGKPIGSDEEQNKTTTVTLWGLDGARERAKQLTDEALDILWEFEGGDFLRELTIELLIREN